MTGVPPVLLDQVTDQPPHTDVLPVVVGQMRRLVEPTVGQCLVEPRAGPRHGLVPQRVETLRSVVVGDAQLPFLYVVRRPLQEPQPTAGSRPPGCIRCRVSPYVPLLGPWAVRAVTLGIIRTAGQGSYSGHHPRKRLSSSAFTPPAIRCGRLGC